MIEPTPSDIGRRVIYRERGTHPLRRVEHGVLTSYNTHCAFVLYSGVTSAATDFADLEWGSGLRVLVCGGRDYHDLDAVWGRLSAIHALRGIAAVIQGGSSGADYLAKIWAHANDVPSIEFKAEWQRFPRGAAGPIRNRRMLDEGKPDLVVAFPGGDGTADMVRQARRGAVDIEEIG